MDTRVTRQWPAPYLQPDKTRDCHFYAVAYICRCLGYPDVTAEAVRAFRETPNADGRFTKETMYPETVLGAEMDAYWRSYEDKHWWLGPDARGWVEAKLADGWIGWVSVWRVQTMAHACVLLEDRSDAGALLMDPVYGHVVEPWPWLLSAGAGHTDCHRIEAWYRMPS